MDSGTHLKQKQPRKIKAAPWCWQHKDALEMIRTYLEDNYGHSAFALSTYVALSEFASDAQSERFTVPISQIARRAGASYRTTAEILNRLESLGLIRIQRNTVPGTKEGRRATLCGAR
jgi:DNA-binding MarR family transcriptional regulator